MIILEALRTIFAILMVFSISIFVHELGHFLFMKLFGVRVERFAIGFGKRLFGFEYAGTDFCLCAFPFGGYVKPVGMHSKEFEQMLEEEKAAESTKDKPQESGEGEPAGEVARSSEYAPRNMATDVADEVAAMRNKAWWQKVIILSAGCAFNLMAAAFAVFLLFYIGHYIAPPQEARVESLSGLDSLVNVRKGDFIRKVNAKPVANADEAYDALLAAGTATDPTTVVLTLERDGRELQSEIPVHPVASWPRNQEDIAAIGGVTVDSPQAIPSILRKFMEKSDQTTVSIVARLAGGKTQDSIVPIAALSGPVWFGSALKFRIPPYVDGVLPNLPADKAGVLKGDTILSVAGVPVTSSEEARSEIMVRINSATELKVQRKNQATGDLEIKTLEVLIRPDPLQPERGRIGIFFGLPRTELRQTGFMESLVNGVTRVGTAIRLNWHALGTVFGSGNLSYIGENVGGPIAIGVMTAKAAGEGWTDLVMLFVMFNVMLAICNIMPIPVLDGGHIVFATVEAIMGKPIPVKVFVGIHNVFIILILGLALTLTLNDVFRNSWRVLGIFQ